MSDEMETQLSVYDDLFNETSSNSNKLYALLILYGGMSVYVFQLLNTISVKSADTNTFLEQTVHPNISSFLICTLTLMYVFGATVEKFVIIHSKYHISNDSVLHLGIDELKKVNKNMYNFNISQKTSIYCMLRLILVFLVNILIIISGLGSVYEQSGMGSIFHSGVFLINLMMLYGLLLTLMHFWLSLNQEKINWMKVFKRDAQEKKKWRKLWDTGLFSQSNFVTSVLIFLPIIVGDITPIFTYVLVSSIIVIIFLIYTFV